MIIIQEEHFDHGTHKVTLRRYQEAWGRELFGAARYVNNYPQGNWDGWPEQVSKDVFNAWMQFECNVASLKRSGQHASDT